MAGAVSTGYPRPPLGHAFTYLLTTSLQHRTRVCGRSADLVVRDLRRQSVSQSAAAGQRMECTSRPDGRLVNVASQPLPLPDDTDRIRSPWIYSAHNGIQLASAAAVSIHSQTAAFLDTPITSTASAYSQAASARGPRRPEPLENSTEN